MAERKSVFAGVNISNEVITTLFLLKLLRRELSNTRPLIFFSEISGESNKEVWSVFQHIYYVELKMINAFNVQVEIAQNNQNSTIICSKNRYNIAVVTMNKNYFIAPANSNS